MQAVSATYRQLLADPKHWAEYRVLIGPDTGRLLTESGALLTIGGKAISTGLVGPEGGYRENMLIEVESDGCVFSGDVPKIGCACSGTLRVEMLRPAAKIHKMARVVPWVRLRHGDLYSEWIQKGVYYIDTRNNDTTGSRDELTLSCFDAMIFAEADYPETRLSWPATDKAVLQEIAGAMGVGIEPETLTAINRSYPIQLPTGYSQREVLGYIAGAYGGSFIMSDTGKLKLLILMDIPR